VESPETMTSPRVSRAEYSDIALGVKEDHQIKRVIAKSPKEQ